MSRITSVAGNRAGFLEVRAAAVRLYLRLKSRHAHVEVRGRRLGMSAGGPEKPFTRADLHEKFTDCASQVLSADRIRRALELIESIEKLKSVRELVQAMNA